MNTGMRTRLNTRLSTRLNNRFARRITRYVGAAIVTVLCVAVAPGMELLAQSGPPQSRQQRGTSTRGDREMEQQVQRRIGAMLKERLSLTDEQLTQLEEVTKKLDRDRRSVRSEEYRLRSTMRAQLLAGDSASNDTIALLLERMPRLERRKIDLMEAEQKELAQFLSPLQRARYVALQDEIRRNMDEIREKRESAPPGSGSRTPPPGTSGRTRPPWVRP